MTSKTMEIGGNRTNGAQVERRMVELCLEKRDQIRLYARCSTIDFLDRTEAMRNKLIMFDQSDLVGAQGSWGRGALSASFNFELSAANQWRFPTFIAGIHFNPVRARS